MSDEGWDLGSGAESFESIFNGAQEDGIQHLEMGDPDRYSHCGGEEDCGDAWRVYDHRTEGRLHINKRSLDLYQKESESYSAYGDAEGDATLEGAVYGLLRRRISCIRILTWGRAETGPIRESYIKRMIWWQPRQPIRTGTRISWYIRRRRE